MASSSPKQKKEEIYRCPKCKIGIENFNSLKLKTLYECGKCSSYFFIEKTPKFFYYI